jgi:chromosome segregation protein
MYLKRLEMQGFKSFVEKTNMEFTSGVTAVVGPNGSGKSNISDAIRWVMGEQSAKSLRGGNMQDVIFAGTQKRKPLGFAQVTLVIDNSEKKLPIDYDEVEITRRVFRSGESEYYINKASCRLKDIHELFMDTGVGRDGYSLIGQGRIAEIIGSKAEERRQIFEEAAGITKYRYRKEEAERKLAHTRDNIIRVSDIISELEIQIEPLRLQSEKAKKYLDLRERLKTLEVNVSLQNIERFKKSLDEVQGLYDNAQRQLSGAGQEIEGIEAEINKMFDSLREYDEETEQKRKQLSDSSAMHANCHSDIEVLKNKIEYNCESIKRIESEINELNDKLAELEQSLSEKGSDIDNLTKREKELQDRISLLEGEVQSLEEKEKEQEDKAERLGFAIGEKTKAVEEIKTKSANLHAFLSSFDSRTRDIEKELEEGKSLYESLISGIKSAQEEYDSKSLELQGLDEKCKKLQGRIDECSSLSARAEEKTREIQLALDKAKARRKMLEDAEEAYESYSHSVKTVMRAKQSGELKGLSLYGTVAQLISVPRQYTVAIETALGGAAQNIVAETEEDAKHAIEYLKKKKAGRATFLPIASVKGSRLETKDIDTQKGFVSIASDLTDCKEKFKNIVGGLLGRIAVFDNIDNAVAAARKYGYSFRIVTLEGELLSPSGAISGGSGGTGSGLVSRANEITRLKADESELEKALGGAQKEELRLKGELGDTRRLLDDAQSEAEAMRERLIALSSEIMHTKNFLQSVETAREALLREKVQISEKAAAMQAEINENNEVVQTAGFEIEELAGQVQSAKEEKARIAAYREEKAKDIVRLRMEHGDIKKDIQLHNERTLIINTRKKEIMQAIGDKKSNIEEIAGKNDDIKDDIEFKKQQIEEIKADIDEFNREIALLAEKRKGAEDRIKENQKLLTGKREAQLALQQELGRIESKKAKAEAELENTVNRLWEEYELTVSSAQKYKADIGNVSKAQKEINSLKEKMRSLGNINIDAIEEYKNIRERFEFLTKQRDDLEAAGKNLEKVIADMVKIMKERFAEKFKDINNSFGEVFRELFGGGTAVLTLTDPDNVLESGVDIDVQPPGKAVKSLMQLSGGEQAFVSIALLFAILKVRPSPFCILDEIEAALDDVNVYRFAAYLKKFAKKSQFIVITHRRGTMEIADMLYGVTMQEQGVTSLLSLNINKIGLEESAG